ncbi:MAG: hypothetical protein KME27_10980 [Lyngbya sp. HA4199-MV5]|jgi:hypothetical protein|nr:hypothetical protein [Lyngbya sp. HA4199-MV5]
MGDRLRAGANVHRYPALVEAGFGAVWVGPGFRDFAPDVVRAACRHKAKNNLPDEYADGQTYIANAIRDENWAAIEMLVTAVETQSKLSSAPAYEVLPIEPLPDRDPPPTPEQAAQKLAHIKALIANANKPKESAHASH